MIFWLFVVLPWQFYILCCLISLVLHKIVPKQKWKLPEIKEGRIDIGRLDLLARQTRPGDPDEFYTVLDLTQRNVNMALLHIFYMCTEPFTYLRFCLMDDWGCYATWFTLLNTLFFPIKPLFTLFVVTI